MSEKMECDEPLSAFADAQVADESAADTQVADGGAGSNSTPIEDLVIDDEKAHFPSDHPDPELDIDDDDGRLYKRLSVTCCFGPMMRKFPRAMICCFGIILPLLFLVFLCLFFGIILASLEADAEVEANDDLLARRLIVNSRSSAVTNVTVAVPRVCLQAFLEGHPPTPFDDVLVDLILEDPYRFRDEHPDLFEHFSTNKTNMTEVYDFLVECGLGSRAFADERFDETRAALAGPLDGLSFNWIRCYPGARDLKVDVSDDLLAHSERNPAKQAEFYETNWNEDYDRLNAQYAQELPKRTVKGLFEASRRAVEDATGGNQCNLNGSGSAWFWFTIETTMGYGNQAPVSSGGRALVYTAGFFSILSFGAVLATTGYIVLALWDDFCMCHTRYLTVLAEPRWACIVWGSAWLLWMLLIASVTRSWKKTRLDETMGWQDAYWFAYISTTTVGLGDFYLEPSVIVGIDLLYFPLMFLVGFTFLSAFLGKFSALLGEALSNGKRALADSVLIHMRDNHHTLSASFKEKHLRARGKG